MNIKKLASVSLACGAIALSAAPAQAGLWLSLDDGVNAPVVVADNGTGDSWGASMPGGGSGTIMWAGGLGSWVVNVSTGISFAPSGEAGIDLNSIDYSSGAGTLRIAMWTDSADFTSPIGSYDFRTGIGGTTNGKVNVEGWINQGSWSFVNGMGPMVGNPSFSGDVATGVNTTGAFDLGQVVTITHAGAGSTSFNSVVSVPEPAILGLLGLGLLGFFGFARRQRGS